jgi:hypothetical protein
VKSLQLGPARLEQLLRDEQASVRRVALQLWRRQARSSSPSELCSFLWSLGEIENFDATAIVSATLDHDHPKVRMIARLALLGLHPLLGLPVRLDIAEPPTEPHTKMQDWVAPRQVFEQTLVDMLGDPHTHVHHLVDSLATCDGEAARIHEILRQAHDSTLLDRYQLAQQNRRDQSVAPQLIVSLTRRCSRSCDYCYIFEAERLQGEELDWNRLIDAIDWAESMGAKRVSFTGGEPTEYSRFQELLQELHQRGLRTYLNTHGLLSDAAMTALQSPAVSRVGIHLSPQRSYTRNQLDHLGACARALTYGGTDVFIRFTQRDSDHADTPWLVEFTGRLSIRHINFAYAFPNLGRSNQYLALSHLVLAKKGLFSLLTAASERGIRVRIAKPLPLCLFTRKEYAKFQRQHDLPATCTIHEDQCLHNLVVDTTGRVLPCVGLPVPGPTLEDRDLDSIRAHCQVHIRNALAQLQVNCLGCALLSLGVCQRACLAHGVGSWNGPQEKAYS